MKLSEYFAEIERGHKIPHDVVDRILQFARIEINTDRNHSKFPVLSRIIVTSDVNSQVKFSGIITGMIAKSKRRSRNYFVETFYS